MSDEIEQTNLRLGLADSLLGPGERPGCWGRGSSLRVRPRRRWGRVQFGASSLVASRGGGLAFGLATAPNRVRRPLLRIRLACLPSPTGVRQSSRFTLICNWISKSIVNLRVKQSETVPYVAYFWLLYPLLWRQVAKLFQVLHHGRLLSHGRNWRGMCICLAQFSAHPASG